MNILINSAKALDPILVEQLVSLPETSIYLSLSPEDTLRILSETRPEILITDRASATDKFLKQILASFPGVEVYFYEKAGDREGSYSLSCQIKGMNQAQNALNRSLAGTAIRSAPSIKDINNKTTIYQNHTKTRRSK